MDEETMLYIERMRDRILDEATSTACDRVAMELGLSPEDVQEAFEKWEENR